MFEGVQAVSLKLVLEIVFELVGYIRGAVRLYLQAKREGWIDDGKALVEKIKEAKTDEERRELLRRLVAHDRVLP